MELTYKRGAEVATLAHKTGKFEYAVFLDGVQIATIRPYSAYWDRKPKGSRIVTSRKNVTRFSVDWRYGTEFVKNEEVASEIRHRSWTGIHNVPEAKQKIARITAILETTDVA